MTAYASRTGTKRNLAALRAAGWRLMVSARGVLRTEGFAYSLDNGAWTAHQRGQAFDGAAFERALRMLGAGADFVVVPDIVEGGLVSLRFSARWLPAVLAVAPRALIAVQDGMEPKHIEPIMRPGMGIFLGGSTEWKLRVMPQWGEFCKGRYYYHIARVNTVRRILYASSCGADSFDGTSVCQFPVNLKKLNKARNQMALPF